MHFRSPKVGRGNGRIAQEGAGLEDEDEGGRGERSDQ